MKTLTGKWSNLDGTPVSGGRVFLKLSQDAVALGATQVSTALISFNLDANGAVVSGSSIWANDELSPSGTTYSVSVIAAGGGTVWGAENISLVGSSPININNAVPSSSGVVIPNAVVTNPTAAQTITGFDLNISGANLNVTGNTSVTGTATTVASHVTGNETVDGTLGVTGLSTLKATTIKSLNGLAVVFADQYADIQTAINALPAAGGVVDARSPNTNLTMGAIDVASNTKEVTLLLGPFTYTFTQMTVRQGFNIIGAGYLSTTLQNVGTNANPAFVIPQVNNNAIIIHWSDFQVLGLAGNTSQDGIFFDASTLTNAGVELSSFMNLQFTGFLGSTIHLKATQDGVSGSIGAIQENVFINVTAIRPTGATGATQNALRIEGGCGQIDFFSCQLVGQTSDTGTNVFVGTTGTQAPYSIHFHNTTNQNGFAYKLDGAIGCTTDVDHFESIKGCYNIATTASPVIGFKATAPYLNSNVAVNAGNGYIVNVPVGTPGVDVLVDSPFIGGQPDNGIKNLSNATNVRMINAQINPTNTPVNVIPNTGTTFVGTPAATLDIHCCRTVQLSASGTSITTLKSGLQPGETVTFYTTGGTAQFATGGNLSLGGNSSPLVVPSGDSATFMRVDAGTPAFVLIGYSRGTNSLINTSATGTGSGNSITLIDSQDTLGNVTGNGGDQPIYTKQIPANTIQAGKGFRIRMHAISNNAVSCVWKVSVGGTTQTLATTTTIANYDVTVEVFNNAGVQTAQRCMAFGFEGPAVATNTTFTAAENFANAITVKITASEANPNTVTPDKWFIELIQ